MRRFWKLSLPLLCLAGCANPADDQPNSSDPPQAPSSAKREGGPYDFSKELTPEKARELIPKAASLSQEEFREILRQPPVRLEEIENQSLTALLLAIDPVVAERQNRSARREFHFAGAPFFTPDPALLRSTLQGDSDTSYVSVIQPEYITDCTCLTRGETAKGTVAFRADNLYAGEAHFTARRTGETWQIVAFHMPEYGLLTERQPDGRWQLASGDSLLGIEYR